MMALAKRAGALYADPAFDPALARVLHADFHAAYLMCMRGLGLRGLVAVGAHPSRVIMPLPAELSPRRFARSRRVVAAAGGRRATDVYRPWTHVGRIVQSCMCGTCGTLSDRHVHVRVGIR